jgi:hypothetical protein
METHLGSVSFVSRGQRELILPVALLLGLLLHLRGVALLGVALGGHVLAGHPAESDRRRSAKRAFVAAIWRANATVDTFSRSLATPGSG